VGPSMGPLHVNARKMVNLMASESGSKWCERRPNVDIRKKNEKKLFCQE
jgi:hypothetical protein